MRAFAVARLCKVRPLRRGGMPPGFRRDYTYQVLSGVFPNGTSDLHFTVVNESGQDVILLATDVTLLDPDAANGGTIGANGFARLCKVPPRRGAPVPGFRIDYRYQALAEVFPNSSSDLHIVVVNESGTAVVLLASDVILLDPAQAGGSQATVGGSGGGTGGSGGGSGGGGGTSTGHSASYDFAANRSWTVSYGWGMPVQVIALNASRIQMMPHRVSFDPSFNVITVDWSYPVAGKLVLTT